MCGPAQPQGTHCGPFCSSREDEGAPPTLQAKTGPAYSAGDEHFALCTPVYNGLLVKVTPIEHLLCPPHTHQLLLLTQFPLLYFPF